MPKKQPIDILEALKANLAERQSIDKQVVIERDDFVQSESGIGNQTQELVHQANPTPRSFCNTKTDEQLELLFLPLSVQSSWLPAKGFVTFHRRRFGNSDIVCESRRLPNGLEVGLPTGIQARRILMAAITRSVQMKSRHVHVPSLVQLMEWAGLYFTGKRHRAAQKTLLQLQLMDTTIWFGSQKSYQIHDGKIFDSLSMEITKNKQGTFDFIPQEVVFTEKFYKQVIENRAMPFDKDLVFKASSPIEHDILIWLITRQADWRLKDKPVKLSYEMLYPQFAREWQDQTQFKYWFKKALLSVVQKFSRNVDVNKNFVSIGHQASTVPVRRFK